MTSNAYIASDGEKLMKVGKSNNPKRREKQIDLTITLTIGCLDEVSAYRIESQLRQFIIERGGIKHASTVDWFIFDPQIYRMVCEFAANIDGFTPLSDDDSQEAEIAVLRKRYFQLLAEERDPNLKENLLKAENEKLKRHLDDTREALETEREQHEKLLRELGHWEAKHELLSEELRSQRNSFLDQLSEAQHEKNDFVEAASYWHGMLVGLRDSMIDRGSKPIDPEVLMNILNSLLQNAPVKSTAEG
jgi:hypothetical protein